MAVLVIALKHDLHSDAVVDHLSRHGVPIVRIDPTESCSLPTAIKIISEPIFQTSYDFECGQGLDPTLVTGVLCRFAINSLVPAPESQPLERFSEAERIATFLAPLRMIHSSCWINDPWVEERADCRIFQAFLARSLGLNVPEFLVSTCYEDLISFEHRHKHSGVVIKTISDAPLAEVEREFIAPEELQATEFNAPYTADFSSSVINRSLVDSSPTLLQLRIPKKADIRATVVDQHIFAAAMPFHFGSPVDFRQELNVEVHAFELPSEIAQKLVELVARLRLRFASCDLILDQSDGFQFLEANVSGNWLWTEQGAGLPISTAIAKALMNPPSQ